MNKIITTCFGLLLSCVLFACSSTTEPETTDSDYAEEKMVLPDENAGLVDLKEVNNQWLIVCTNPQDNISTVYQGSSNDWNKLFDDIAISNNPDRKAHLTSAAFTNNNELLAAYVYEDSDEIELYRISNDSNTLVSLYDESGNKTEITSSINLIKPLIEDQACILDENQNLVVINTESGKVINNLKNPRENSHIIDVNAKNSTVYLLTSSNDTTEHPYELTALNLETGEKLNNVDTATTQAQEICQSVSNKDKPPVIGLTNNSIFVSANGSLFECSDSGQKTLLDHHTTLESPSLLPAQIVENSDQQGMIITYISLESSGSPTYTYCYSPKEGSATTTSLTIYTLYENPSIQQAAALFKDQNPSVETKIDIGIPADSNISSEDAINSLNNRIISGDAPDLIVLDGLPINLLSSKGALLNLKEVTTNYSSEEYLSNIINCISDNETCYALPTRFVVPGAIGNTSILSSTSSAADLLAQLNNNTQSDQLAPSYGLNSLYLSYLSETEGTTSTQSIEQFLLDCQDTMNFSNINLPKRSNDSENTFFNESISYLDNPQKSDRGEWLLQTSCEVGLLTIDSIADFATMKVVLENTSYPSEYKYWESESGYVFQPTSILGISSNTSHKSEAIQFIDFVLSDQQQAQTQSTGLPVRISSYTNFLGRGGYELDFQNETGNQTFSASQFTEDEIKEIIRNLSRCETAVMPDSVLTDSFKDSLTKISNREQTTEAAADSISQKIKLYNEE